MQRLGLVGRVYRSPPAARERDAACDITATKPDSAAFQGAQILCSHWTVLDSQPLADRRSGPGPQRWPTTRGRKLAPGEPELRRSGPLRNHPLETAPAKGLGALHPKQRRCL